MKRTKTSWLIVSVGLTMAWMASMAEAQAPKVKPVPGLPGCAAVKGLTDVKSVRSSGPLGPRVCEEKKEWRLTNTCGRVVRFHYHPDKQLKLLTLEKTLTLQPGRSATVSCCSPLQPCDRPGFEVSFPNEPGRHPVQIDDRAGLTNRKAGLLQDETGGQVSAAFEGNWQLTAVNGQPVVDHLLTEEIGLEILNRGILRFTKNPPRGPHVSCTSEFSWKRGPSEHSLKNTVRYTCPSTFGQGLGPVVIEKVTECTLESDRAMVCTRTADLSRPDGVTLRYAKAANLKR